MLFSARTTSGIETHEKVEDTFRRRKHLLRHKD
jgi:hypothetical protein